MTPLQPGDRLDQYILEELVARSGMATIFRGRDTDTGKRVAVKIPHPEVECDPVMFERFRREIQIGEQIDHPGVIRAIPQDRRARPYMAAEWIDGVSLRSILDREKALPVERAFRIAQAVCEALEHLHSRGILHRDLKPENIMVRNDDTITLIDFGLASLKGARRLTFGKFSRIMGTVDYISPEQAQGKRGDARSDIYAVGVILYEMLAGKTPWEAPNPFVAMQERVTHMPVPLRCLNANIPAYADAVVQHALERDPAARFAQASDLLQALRHPEHFDATRTIANSVSPLKPSWPLSLLMIPVSILMMLLYAASRQ